MGSLIGLLLLGALVYAVKRHLLEGRGSGSALEREELANAESARNTIGMIENPLVRGASFAAGEGSSVVANAGNSGNTETHGSASTPVYAEVLDPPPPQKKKTSLNPLASQQRQRRCVMLDYML